MLAIVFVFCALPGQTGGVGPRDEAIRLQVALDRAGFSPGIIDGSCGEKTRVAVAAFQEFCGVRGSGKIDAATAQRLNLAAYPPVRRHVVSAGDLAQVIPPPNTWVKKSKARRLGYVSVLDMFAERGHCTEALLQRLNPRVDFRRLSSGDALLLPNVEELSASVQAESLEVNLTQKTVRAVNGRGKVIGLFHCSIARKKEKRPQGEARVISVSREPEYLFDPKMWPEVKNVKRKLTIPAGPRSPVGVCWIGLSLEGYGIHGTPEPENIGKTGSHGCFRLTNWDALRLGEMVRVGTPVRFIDSPQEVERITLRDYSGRR